VTALMFVLSPDSVVIGTDTLAVLPTDKSPHKYASKVFMLPHLGAVICGTGVFQLPLDWYMDIQSSVLARDMDFMNEIAPERLRSIWSRIGADGTSTVYHFGYSPHDGAYVGYAFRSTNDFARERLEYGIGIKPALDELIMVAREMAEEPDIHAMVVSLIESARALDDDLPVDDRVGIGGEIHLLTLTAGRQIGWVVRPWPDFESLYEQMLARLHESNALAE
jgi:hypothetical protein